MVRAEGVDEPAAPRSKDSLDALSRILGGPTLEEERAAKEAELEQERARSGMLLERQRQVQAGEAEFDAQGGMSVGFGLIPIAKDGVLELRTKDEARSIFESRQDWLELQVAAKEPEGAAAAGASGESQPSPAPGAPPTPSLDPAGDTFLLPFIRAPYVQQVGACNKMNLFEPRWLTLFTTMLAGSPLATPEETRWLRSADGSRPLVLTDIPEVVQYNRGFEEFNSGDAVGLLTLFQAEGMNAAACRLPEDAFKGKPR